MGQHQMGLQSMIVTQCIKQLCAKVEKANVCVIGINQMRSTMSQWGSGETTPGGKALKFYASIRVKVAKKSGIKKETTDGLMVTSLIGQRVKFVTVKNKVAPPFREAEVDLYFGRGFDDNATVVEYGIQRGIIVKSGAYFKVKDQNIRGLEAIQEFVAKDPALRQEIISNVGVAENRELPDIERCDAEA